MTTPKQFVDFGLPSTRTLTSQGNCSSRFLSGEPARPQPLMLKLSSPSNAIKSKIFELKLDTLFSKAKLADVGYFNFFIKDQMGKHKNLFTSNFDTEFKILFAPSSNVSLIPTHATRSIIFFVYSIHAKLSYSRRSSILYSLD
jgi:hypothetical protein